jgi:hypothetical protein
MRMRVWTVHLRPAERNRAPRAILLRDGFSLGAFLLPTVWFLANGLVALAALHLAVVAAVAVLLPASAALPLLLGLQLLTGLEARALQSWWLGLRGWRTEGVVMGRDEDAAFLTLAGARPDLARIA